MQQMCSGLRYDVCSKRLLKYENLATHVRSERRNALSSRCGVVTATGLFRHKRKLTQRCKFTQTSVISDVMKVSQFTDSPVVTSCPDRRMDSEIGIRDHHEPDRA
jgi:hypothetical protein